VRGLVMTSKSPGVLNSRTVCGVVTRCRLHLGSSFRFATLRSRSDSSSSGWPVDGSSSAMSATLPYLRRCRCFGFGRFEGVEVVEV